MLDSDRDGYLDDTRRLICLVLAEHSAVAKRLADMRAGFPTGRQGEKPVDPRADWAESKLRQLNRDVMKLHQLASGLDGLRQEVLRTTTHEFVDPGCDVINKHAATDHPVYEPTLYAATDVGGRLRTKHRLGSWAYKQVQMNGEPGEEDDGNLPTRIEVLEHLAGKRVRRRRVGRRRAS